GKALTGYSGSGDGSSHIDLSFTEGVKRDAGAAEERVMTKSTRESRAGMGKRTRLVHAGRQPFEKFGFVNRPIYRGSTGLSADMEALYARKARFIYGTKGTPTTEALENAWSELAGAAGTVLTPSGLSAITVAILSVVKAGDHILVSDSVYRPTRNFCGSVLS